MIPWLGRQPKKIDLVSTPGILFHNRDPDAISNNSHKILQISVESLGFQIIFLFPLKKNRFFFFVYQERTPITTNNIFLL